MSTGSATSMYLIFISRGKSISSLTSQSLLTSTEESLGFSCAWSGSGRKCHMIQGRQGQLNKAQKSRKKNNFKIKIPEISGPISDEHQTASGTFSANACAP